MVVHLLWCDLCIQTPIITILSADCQVRPICPVCPICPISPIFVLYFKKMSYMSYIFALKMYFYQIFIQKFHYDFYLPIQGFKSGSLFVYKSAPLTVCSCLPLIGHNQGPSFNVCEQRTFEYTHQYTPSPPMRIILLEEIAVHDLSFRSADGIGIFFKRFFPTAK